MDRIQKAEHIHNLNVRVNLLEMGLVADEEGYVTVPLSMYHLRQSAMLGNLPSFLFTILEETMNGYHNHCGMGAQVGTALQSSHRTLQGCVVNFMVATLIALGKQEWTDPRNEKAIAMCKKIAEVIAIEDFQAFI